VLHQHQHHQRGEQAGANRKPDDQEYQDIIQDRFIPRCATAGCRRQPVLAP
jgi:hypothetical protein